MNAAIATARPRANDKSRQVIILVCILLLWGAYQAADTDQLIGYSAVTIGAFLPLVVWLRCGGPGLPVYPIPMLLYYVYYALPVFRDVDRHFSSEMVLTAALTAALFIAASVCAWFPFIWWLPSRRRAQEDAVLQTASTLALIFSGLSLGFVYHFMAMSGATSIFGSLHGALRAVAIAASLVGSYLVGHLRARKAIDSGYFALAVFLLGGTIAFSLTSLFLVTTIVYLMAAMIGYALTARQIPWRVGSVALVVLMVLHFGKGDIRARYWANNLDDYQSGVSLAKAPDLLIEWFSTGVSSITSGTYLSEQSLLERGSLLLLLLRVQALTPAQIPYLDGESYAELPEMLVPRFIAEDKTASQSGMRTLNIRYRFQTEADANLTAIGWGLIAEAFANYGYTGVTLIGIVFGMLTGLINRLSIGATPLSWHNFVAVMGMLTLMNPEADLSYIMVNLWQALIAITIFYVALRFLGLKQVVPKGRTWQPS